MKKKPKNLKQYFSRTKNQKLFSWASKGVSTPVAIFVASLVVVAVGVLVWQFWPEEEIVIAPSPSPTISPGPPATPSPTPTPTTDETTDWEVYRNEEYGYELRTPSEWSVVERRDINGEDIDVHFVEPESGSYILDIYMQDVATWHKDFCYVEETKIKDINISSSIKVEIYEDRCTIGGGRVTYTAIFPWKNWVAQIFYDATYSSSSIEEFTKILSTLNSLD